MISSLWTTCLSSRRIRSKSIGQHQEPRHKMASSTNGTAFKDEYPPKAELRKLVAQAPLPVIAPGTVDSDAMGGSEPLKAALTVLDEFNAALAADDAEKLKTCFFPEQAYWKDQLALTYHLRTFATPSAVAASFLETKKLRGLTEGIKIKGDPQFIPATPVLQFIDCDLSFRTTSPGAQCWGRMMLLPIKVDGVLSWKIWNLCTKLESLDLQPEDESLLQAPGRSLEGAKLLETDVFVIGGGNAAAALAVRLKAMGVDSILADRNARVGDNWATRYDCMKFHLPTSFCGLPYMDYAQELQSPHLLTKDDLAGQLRKYAAAFKLNIINSAKILSTKFDGTSKRWTVNFSTPAGEHTVVSKHLVQATGIGSQKPNIPSVADRELYNGISIHSSGFKNGKKIAEKGAKSVVIVGSANTAFDVLEDCHAAGLETTMVVRGPTYIVPLAYICDKRGIGAYEFGVEVGDKLFQTTPPFVDSQMGRGLMTMLASEEPDRYKALAAAGFPVFDSTHKDADLLHNLLERAGGHYVDTEGTKLIAEGKTGLKANVEPVAYTASGLKFSDGSELATDAVIWCTGFADKNVRETSAEILGGNEEAREIASRLDATWGLDAEGEIRGMWKRHLNVENYWVMGGFTSQHRWHSRTLALQIKAAIEGVLPPAYRETPQLPQ